MFPWLLEIGDESAIGDRVQIYNLGPCRIGSRATISQGSHLCGGTHDDKDPTMPLLRCHVEIGDDAWICAEAFVGPGVSVGVGSVVGARAAVMRDVEPWTVTAGNPARKIRDRILRQESPSPLRQEDSP
jgi:putative colanic acid biosynthesis acetyltransferase WcaF